MPKGPQGQKRPADVIGNAVHVKIVKPDFGRIVLIDANGGDLNGVAKRRHYACGT